MGLLSFLSKQSLGDRSRPPASPRSQAYHATVASSPPVKGTYPVPGNGTNAIKGFSRIRNKLSESQLSLNFSTLAEVAPLPSVPRLRDESLQRPSTAPIRSHPTTESQPNGNRLRKANSKGRPPPLSFKKGRKSSLASESSQGSPKPAASPATKPGLRPRLLVASTPATPIRSDAAAKGSKDILDAQSELKPLDFKTRVKAAGVRDYGEDVADRNIGQNGVDLESAEVQEFYARSTDSFINRRSRCASMADISSQYFNNNDDSRGRPATKRTSTGSGLRAKSLGSSSHFSLPQRAPPPIPQVPASIAADPTSALVSRPTVTTSLGRRLSLTTYTTPTSPVEPYRPSSSFRRSISLQRADLPRRSSLLLANERTSQRDSRSSQEPQRHSSLSTVRQPSIPRASRSPNRRDSASVSQKQPGHREADANLEYVRPRQRSFSLSSRRDLRSDSVGSATFGHPGSRHGTRPSISSSIASRDTATENIGTAHAHDTSRFSSAYDERTIGATSTITGLGISASDDLDLGKPSAIRPTPSSPNGHTRTRSLASSLRTLKMDEISDVIPIRTSSIRHWSISSTTPTISDTSSNPSQRPQSRHTADTSVDLRTSFSAKNSSLGSLTSVAAPGSAVVSPKSTKSQAFNIDDYISSDDDYDTPRRPRGEGEEDLLFQDNGYGMNGSLLPGLSDGMPLPGLSSFAPLSPREIPRPRTSSSLPPNYLQNSFGSPTFSPGPISYPRSRRYVIDTAAHYDDDVDGDDDYLYREEPTLPGLSPMRGGPASRGTKRFTALGKMYDGHQRPSSSSSYHHHGHHHHHHHHHHRGSEDVIEEERDMSKIDIAAAVRMRKEAKARMRADIAAARKRRPSKARRRRSLAGPDADEEHHADTEC